MEAADSESLDGLGYLEHILNISEPLISTGYQVRHRRFCSSPGHKERSSVPIWHPLSSDRRYPDATDSEALEELDEQLGPANGIRVYPLVATATSLHPDKIDPIMY